MSTSSHPKIRRLLHIYHDGLTARDIEERTEIKPNTVRNALQDMPDTYIDRWVVVSGIAPMAVWCAVVPPENCPKPLTKEQKNDHRN